MAKTLPNFGQISVATRNGWKYAEDLRLFVRISPSNGNYKVELQPATFVPESSEDPYQEGHWRSQENVIYRIPALNKYMGRQKALTFYIDDDGLEVPAPDIPVEEPKILDTERQEESPNSVAMSVKDDTENNPEEVNDQA